MACRLSSATALVHPCLRPHDCRACWHQAKKGNQWYFGMKARIGVDKVSCLVHTLTTTAANVSDISQTAAALHGQESDVWADAGYVGVPKREDMQETLAANDQTMQWRVAKRRKTVEGLSDEGWQKSLAQAIVGKAARKTPGSSSTTA